MSISAKRVSAREPATIAAFQSRSREIRQQYQSLATEVSAFLLKYKRMDQAAAVLKDGARACVVLNQQLSRFAGESVVWVHMPDDEPSNTPRATKLICPKELISKLLDDLEIPRRINWVRITCEWGKEDPILVECKLVAVKEAAE